MKPETLKELLEKIGNVRIAIIGDFCLDAYWFVDESKREISIETGKPTTPVSIQKYSLGGAGNVASNLASLGAGQIWTLGVTGRDPFASEMISLMESAGINTDYLLTQETSWSTHVYIKPHIGETEQSRIDFGNFNRLSEETAVSLLASLEKVSKEASLVIINQQVLSGIHTPFFRKKLVDVISSLPEKIFIADSRNFMEDYTGAYRKMNDSEAARLCGIAKQPGEIISRNEVLEFASQLNLRFGKPVFITRGGNGSVVAGENGITEVPGLMIISPTDTVGAGDSYLAGAAATLAAGYSLETAALLGTYTAGVTVQKLYQTGTASPEEIIAIGSSPDFSYNPDIASDIRHAEYHGGTEIEIIKKPDEKLKVKYAVFDNDGTISALREGWEHIMAPMMIKAILGEKYSEAGESLYARVKNAVNEMIDKTTGVQTLKQMQMLIKLVRDFGCVDEKDILDEAGYKLIYNKELLAMVREREEKLKEGEISVDDLTIKGSVAFLHALYNRGVKLFLTSGTDEEDVKHEAAVLAYDHLFEGRIYGATGRIDTEAKKVVLDRLLDSLGTEESSAIVTFGDGPVEIRETRKRGGVTVGVASNEIRRYGLNITKRTRLIKAGADLIIPDFSQYEKLLQLLNIR